MRVGFTFNLKRDGSDDREAEFDSPKTVAAIHGAIASLGHEVIDLEATPALVQTLPAARPDLVFNIAEGYRGRNRESLVPALCELLGIAYTGSDPAATAICHDKDLAKRMVASHGIDTPAHTTLFDSGDPLPGGVRYPMILKPVAEGTSKGITHRSVVANERELRVLAGELIAAYRQPVLAEEYVHGRELTVGLLGDTRSPRVLPAKETVFLDPDETAPVYSYDLKQDWNEKVRHVAPAQLSREEAAALESVARRTFAALGCRDVARIDYRLTPEGRYAFIECNPLPGLSPGWSDLALIAAAANLTYESLIAEILQPAIVRSRDVRS